MYSEVIVASLCNFWQPLEDPHYFATTLMCRCETFGFAPTQSSIISLLVKAVFVAYSHLIKAAL